MNKFGLLICGMVAILLLAGCGQGMEHDKDTEEEPVTATWFCDVALWKPPAWDVQEGTVMKDITENTGLVFDIEVPSENAGTKLAIKIVDKELPDIITTTDTELVKKMIDADAVWRLDEFLETYVPDGRLLKNFPQDVRDYLTKRDGGFYVFPSHLKSQDNEKEYPPCDEFYKKLTKYAHNDGIIWNEKILKQAGFTLEDVGTEEAVLNVFEKIRDRNLTVDGKPVILCLTDGKETFQAERLNSGLGVFFNIFGAEGMDEKGQFQFRVSQPQAEDALRFLNHLIRNGYLESRYITINKEEVLEYIKEGRVLCYVGNIADTGINVLENAGEIWGSNGPFLASNGSMPVYGDAGNRVSFWLNTLISKKCRYPERIARWMEYMTSEEGWMLTQYGYEGIDYELNAKGQVERTISENRSGVPYSMSGIGAWWAFANTDRAYSKRAPVEEGSSTYVQETLRMAFTMNKNTRLLDYGAYEEMQEKCAQDEELTSMEKELNEFVNDKILELLMAETDREFEEEYRKLLQGIQEHGGDEVAGRKNQYLREAKRDIDFCK